MPPEDKEASWLEVLADGGLPQIIAGPAGKAISRLVGATIEIPAAYIDGYAQTSEIKTRPKVNLHKR